MTETNGIKVGPGTFWTFIVVGLGGFFAFISSFLTISSLLGGGWGGIGISIILALATVVILGLGWRRFFKHRRGSETLIDNEVCDPGPHTLGPRGREKILLHVKKNYQIRGHVVEREGQKFDWGIMSEQNVVRLYRNQSTLKAGVGPSEWDVPASEVSWRVPREGPWYMVLDTSRKQNPRTVEIHLRRVD